MLISPTFETKRVKAEIGPAKIAQNSKCCSLLAMELILRPRPQVFLKTELFPFSKKAFRHITDIRIVLPPSHKNVKTMEI